MKPTEEQIKEIAEHLDCGELCFFHLKTGNFEHFPDPENPYAEIEELQDILDKIDADEDNYLKIKPMNSNQGFLVMEEFSNSLTDEQLKKQLLVQLSQRNPFRKFKWLIDNSNYRQNWFDFKNQAYINWVREQFCNENL